MDLYKDNEISKITENSIGDKQLYLVTKRVIDIIGSLVCIILFTIPMTIIVIAIKIEDPKGKILFIQDRHGKNGVTFKMFKFRSMVNNAEELLSELEDQNDMDGPAFKMNDDPRMTKVGKFIRKTSLDEVPQFFNVLKGNMSFVGPRPAVPQEVSGYTSYERQRLLVKPGITCIWQVNGRNTLTFGERIELDLKYISERNLLLDMSLILKTVPVLFGDKNAS